MQPISQILPRLELLPTATTTNNNRSFLRGTPSAWGEAFLQACDYIMHVERNEPVTHSFIIDDHNRDLINQMYQYSIGSNLFQGDIYKGIYMYGAIGTGKTIILKATCAILDKYTIKNIPFMIAKKLEKLVIERGESVFSELEKKPLFLDDIMKEEKEVLHFNQKHSPFIDLMSLRYDTGAWTFLTSNYKEETTEEHYGKMMFSRMKSMMNFIEVTKTGYEIKKFEQVNRRV
jgi:DNA replication protein DnaC